MTGRQFVSTVNKVKGVNIPSTFANHHDIKQGDTVELRVVSHKRDGETLYDENQNNEPQR